MRSAIIVPLPILVSRVLLAFERDYGNDSESSDETSHESSNESNMPSMPVLANILRVVEPAGVDLKTMPGLARISERAVRVATQNLERHGWLTVRSVKRGQKTVLLTPAGDAARASGFARLAETEGKWNARFGADGLHRLRAASAALVRQLDIELPHYPSGYGQGDTSIHGGPFVPGSEVPRVPAHGAEWPVVLREDRVTLDDLPLNALLSQVYCAFAIDYDADAESVLAGLHSVLTFLRFVDDAGIPLAEVKVLGQVNGTGRAGFERHRLVKVEAKVARLTEHGARVRDRYPARVRQIETDWAALYGAKVVTELRDALTAFDPGEGAGLADCVDVSGWLKRRSVIS